VTGALPARIRCRSCRDTPSSRAACETFMRKAGSTSSRRISGMGRLPLQSPSNREHLRRPLRRHHRRRLPLSDTARDRDPSRVL
jgi:hypothetical protein